MLRTRSATAVSSDTANVGSDLTRLRNTLRLMASGAQAADHVAHQHEGELGVAAQRGLESPAVERDHAARGRGERGRAARRLAEGGPLAEDLPGGHGADRLALHQQGHFALEQVVHLVALQEEAARLLVLAEDPGAGRDVFRLSRGPEK